MSNILPEHKEIIDHNNKNFGNKIEPVHSINFTVQNQYNIKQQKYYVDN